jgi:ribonuclease HIII
MIWAFMSNNIVTIKADRELLNQIIAYYQKYQTANDGQYILFQAKKSQVTITAYQNTKGKETKVTFCGEGFIKEAKRWNRDIVPPKEESADEGPLGWFEIDDQIGSDEVGTGDFLGPICVCAAFLKKEDVAYLKRVGVADSKKVSDEYILQIAPSLIKRFSYSQVSLSNEKYNELVQKGININEIKARLHNRVLLNLIKKHGPRHVYVDKFVSESRYFTYASRDHEIVRNIVFKTKGESRYPSVALASIIARYSFLKKMEAIGNRYKRVIPFGASSKVDAFAISFIKEYGVAELDKIAKVNFENYKRVIGASNNT